MEIEILYLEDCPNWKPTHDLVTAVLNAHGIPAQVLTTLVSDEADAQAKRFHGSPSVRIGGQDVEPEKETQPPFFGCRLYWEDGKAKGHPSREMIEKALLRGE